MLLITVKRVYTKSSEETRRIHSSQSSPIKPVRNCKFIRGNLKLLATDENIKHGIQVIKSKKKKKNPGAATKEGHQEANISLLDHRIPKSN